MRLTLTSLITSCILSGAVLAQNDTKPGTLPPLDPAKLQGAIKFISILRKNNEVWSNGTLKSDPDAFKRLANSQSPDTLWIGCSDSRVPETTIFNSTPGLFFVHRNIANQFLPGDQSANSVLSYAVNALNISNVIVAGHTNCGGIKGAYESAKGPGAQSAHRRRSIPEAVQQWIGPLTKDAQAHLQGKGDTSIEAFAGANVLKQVQNVAVSQVMQDAWKSGKQVYIHGMVYDVGQGKFANFGVTMPPNSVSFSSSKGSKP